MVLLELFLTFLKIGLFSIGGGYSMLPMIQQEVVARGWMTATELLDFLAVSESTPGSMSVNMSTFIGFKVAGFPGSLIATLGVITPSFVIILLIVTHISTLKKNRYVQNVLKVLKPAVVGFIGSAVITVGAQVLFPSDAPIDPVAFVACGVAIFLAFKKVHPVAIIGLAAVFGIVSGLLL